MPVFTAGLHFWRLMVMFFFATNFSPLVLIQWSGIINCSFITELIAVITASYLSCSRTPINISTAVQTHIQEWVCTSNFWLTTFNQFQSIHSRLKAFNQSIKKSQLLPAVQQSTDKNNPIASWQCFRTKSAYNSFCGNFKLRSTEMEWIMASRMAQSSSFALSISGSSISSASSASWKITIKISNKCDAL